MKSNIANAINEAHGKVEASRSAAVAAARECGELLLNAKATVPHGGWDEWVKAHCAFTLRTAQLYMKVARDLADGDPAKAQRVADLSLRDASMALASRKRPTKAEASAAEDVECIVSKWADASPAAREKFAREIHKRGDITLEQRNQMIGAAWHDATASEKEAAERFVLLCREHLPDDEFQKVAQTIRKYRLTGPELAVAIGDAVERRQWVK